MRRPYAVAWPPQGICANKPIAAATGLKRVRWRACSSATARSVERVPHSGTFLPESMKR